MIKDLVHKIDSGFKTLRGYSYNVDLYQDIFI